MIIVGHVLADRTADCVCCRNDDGTSMAVELLLDHGRRQFAYIGGPSDWFSEQERFRGLRRRLGQQGLSPIAHVPSDYMYSGGHGSARWLLQAHPRLDAIIRANDAMALGTLSFLRREAWVEVPGDISVVGFDNIAMSAWP